MELKSPEHPIQNLKYIEILRNIYRPFLMGQFIQKKKKICQFKQLIQKLKWNFMLEIPLS